MLKEISREFDIPNKVVRLKVTDDLGAEQDVHLAVARDGCPMCNTPYIKTGLGVVDVEATLAAISAAQDVHIDNALASLQAAGADVGAVMAARAKK